MTVFADLLTRVKTALAQAPALAGGFVSVNRLRPIPAGQSTAIVLRLPRAQGLETVLGTLDWTSTLVVECYARADSPTDPLTLADQLLGQVWGRLVAMPYEDLGADVALNPQIDWQFDDGETNMACAIFSLSVQHRTSTTSLDEP